MAPLNPLYIVHIVQVSLRTEARRLREFPMTLLLFNQMSLNEVVIYGDNIHNNYQVLDDKDRCDQPPQPLTLEWGALVGSGLRGHAT